MITHRSIWLALPMAFLLPLGCNNGGTGTEQPTEAAATAPAAAVEAPSPGEHAHRHGRHHQGPAGMLIHAARQLDLSEAQSATVSQLAAQLHGGRGQAADRPQVNRAALAAAVRSGVVDPTRFAPDPAAAQTARQAHAAREATALNGLWAALQPAQRQAAVASVRAKQAERAAHHRAEGQPAGGWQSERLAHLTTQLGLDAAQQQAVQGILAKQHPAPAAVEARHEEMSKRNDALYTAFTGDSFDAQKLDLLPAQEGGMGPAAHHAEFLAQIVPLLRADQRETLAASMEKERE